MGNPQNTYTFNNSHSCALLPLVRRSPVSRIKDSTPNSRTTWWLASRDSCIFHNTYYNYFNYLTIVYQCGYLANHNSDKLLIQGQLGELLLFHFSKVIILFVLI